MQREKMVTADHGLPQPLSSRLLLSLLMETIGGGKKAL
jgi:hypothetical protein